MEITAADFERHYASLSDEALLAIVRDDLVDLAKLCLDREIAGRGLQRSEAAPGAATESEQDVEQQELVDIAEFDTPEEGNYARQMLASHGIHAYLSEDGKNVRDKLDGVGRYLMVPAAVAEEALLLLAAPISDEELAAQAEAADAEDDS